jgi:hypothetical protein
MESGGGAPALLLCGDSSLILAAGIAAMISIYPTILSWIVPLLSVAGKCQFDYTAEHAEGAEKLRKSLRSCNGQQHVEKRWAVLMSF